MNLENYKYVIVGAGFYGCVMAERIANILNVPLLLIEKRDHIGGNCYSQIDGSTGIEYHKYGTHIFHTSNNKVWSYITQFTEFNDYNHHVFSVFNEKTYNFPINLKTINDFYNINLKPYEVQDFLQKELSKEIYTNPKNLEEMAVSLVGRPLYEAFIKGYTKKQWEKDPKELPSFIIQRIPIRQNYNDNYFFDSKQGIPLKGYKALFEKMLKSNNINLLLNTSWESIKNKVSKNATIIYSGPIDAFFDYKFGVLEYRSLKFEYETHNVVDFQGNSVINYASDSTPYTRIHEYKHLHPERKALMDMPETLICKEFSYTYKKGEEMYYPINTPYNKELYERYAEYAKNQHNIKMGGRLGTYQYFDMDKVIEQALNDFSQIKMEYTNE